MPFSSILSCGVCSLLSVTIIHQERAKVNSFLKVFSICTQCTITGFQILENLFILPIDKLLRMWYNGNLRPGGPWPRGRILVICRKSEDFSILAFNYFITLLTDVDRCSFEAATTSALIGADRSYLPSVFYVFCLCYSWLCGTSAVRAFH